MSDIRSLVEDIESAVRNTTTEILGPDWVDKDIVGPEDAFDKMIDFHGLSLVEGDDIAVMSGGRAQGMLRGEISLNLVVNVEPEDLGSYRREIFIYWFRLFAEIMSSPNLGVEHPTLVFSPGEVEEDSLNDTGEDFVYIWLVRVDFTIERLQNKV